MVTETAADSQVRRGKLARAAALCAAVVALGVVGGSARGVVANEDELPTYPETGEYVGVRATSINYAASAKQWIRLPPLFVAAYNRLATTLTDNRCANGDGIYYPYRTEIKRDASLHFRSSPGAPASFGYIGPFIVRAVAFGSIPVEATVQLRQLRESDGKTVGLRIKAVERDYCPGKTPVPGEPAARVTGADATGDLEVAVTALRVDGVDLHLRGTCKTSKPAPLTLSSPEYWVTGSGFAEDRDFYTRSGDGYEQLQPAEEPTRDNLFTTPMFNLVTGGLLTGNVDIPAFKACLTDAGEDISRLLTTTVAGSENPVIVRAEGLDSDPSQVPLPGLPFPSTAP